MRAEDALPSTPPNFLYPRRFRQCVDDRQHDPDVLVYQEGDMPSILGNGSTVPEAFAVLVGEATSSGGGMISTVAYASNGRPEPVFSTTQPSSRILPCSALVCGKDYCHVCFQSCARYILPILR